MDRNEADIPSLPSLLVVDDNLELREQMKWGLKHLYNVHEAGARQEAVEIIKREPIELVTLDLGLPPDADGVVEGLIALEECLAVKAAVKVIVITGNHDRANALKAIQFGAYDFMEKPVDLEVLKVILQRGHYLSQLEDENRMLVERESQRNFHEIIGTSPSMQKVFDTIRRVATSDVSVLVVGESGTGKELIARAIHQQSERKEGSFVAINCGAIPETLLESELFGHEKGSFTGAHLQRRGRIELAEGGTLFLDEIGELSTALQVKLLRVLQERCIERVGGRVEIPVNTRVIAATNLDLQEAMKDGRFREDLYWRLNTVTITAPPLRERGADVMVIAKSLLQRYADETKRKMSGFSREAVEAIERYAWPGNVRELENRIRRAVTLSDHPRIVPADLDLEEPKEFAERTTLKEARDAVERNLVEQTLVKTNGNITKAAVLLGVSRPTLHDLISRHQIEK
ncbi:MAG: PEP-CTERM-box response regulator transcription factor [Nitrospirales bacterium]|nr:PEP-CTERM-box response regulator transcription factor [Nitrospira sp.]MDR4501945.1 PEP-CTERM-box response regulator transcription factor [Nitrospirales bacterium]